MSNKIQQNTFSSEFVATHFEYNLYLENGIKDRDYFIEWFEIFREATESDKITIHINSDGGSLYTATQIITAMRNCKAHIVCSIEGFCASAATLIFLSGDSYVVSDLSVFMIHAYSYSIGHNKRSEIKSSQENSMFHFDKWFKKLYKNFLTKKEIKKVLDGKDYWMGADEVVKRLNKRAKKQQKLQQKLTKDDK